MGKAQRMIRGLINEDLQTDLTNQTLRDLQTMFSDQRNATTDLAARTNLGADAQSAQLRGLQLNQNKAQGNAMLDLQKFFQDLKARQAGLWLQNKAINKKAKASDQAFYADLIPDINIGVGG